MKPVRLKVARIGDSRRVDIPATLSWEDTARAMNLEAEDWSDWDVTLADGLEQIPWEMAPAKRPGK